MKQKKSPSRAVIVTVTPETPHMKHLELRVSDSRKKSYTTPGQFVEVRLPGFKSSPFALACGPAEKNWSILVKNSSPLTRKIFRTKTGDSLEITRPLGKGFNLNVALGKHLLLFAAGSGIAAIRAVIQSVIRDRFHYGSVTLFYGARNPDEFAYRNEFERWKQGGIKIDLTISNKKITDWSGAYGYVQGLVSEGMTLKNTVALVCGMDEMIAQATKRLKDLGFPEKDILTNLP